MGATISGDGLKNAATLITRALAQASVACAGLLFAAHGAFAADDAVSADSSTPKVAAAKPAATKTGKTRKATTASSSTTARRAKHSTSTTSRTVAHAPVRSVVRAEPSVGELQGLHATEDPLNLKSGVALVMDQDTNEILVAKNPQAVVPIASITKLMTGLVVLEAQQPLDEKITITADDRDTEKGTGSRLAFGTTLTRGEMLHLALMSSENRAAHALARNYPGGLEACMAAMNAKAKELGMTDTHYLEPTGLSSDNRSSAEDLARLVKVAHEVPLLREFTTSKEATVHIGRRMLAFHSTNGLVREGKWDIGLQKTGFINEAGKCMVMQAELYGRKLIMVFLDITGRTPRVADAERIRKWLGSNPDALHEGGKLQ